MVGLRPIVEWMTFNFGLLALDQVISTTGNSLWASPLTFLDASVPGTGGFIDTPNQRLTIRHISPIKTAEELAEIVIAGTDKRLKDVAEVVEDHQPLIGDAVKSNDLSGCATSRRCGVGFGKTGWPRSWSRPAPGPTGVPPWPSRGATAGSR